MKLKKMLKAGVCLGIACVTLGGYVSTMAYEYSIYRGNHYGEFESGDWNPLVRDKFRAQLQPCGGIPSGSHYVSASINTQLKYFDSNQNIQTRQETVENFPMQGRLITSKMSTPWYKAPSSHDDRLALGAYVNFTAYCQNCDAHLDTSEYYIED